MAKLAMRPMEWAVLVMWASLTGCSAGEPPAVVTVGARNLRCLRSEVETALQRESAQVREYYVGCDFMYTRVLCSKDKLECHPAKPQPPCFTGGCFKENSLTFEWELDESMARDATALLPAF
jgi:hypothetical protein